jgi:hypothetical protein
MGRNSTTRRAGLLGPFSGAKVRWAITDPRGVIKCAVPMKKVVRRMQHADGQVLWGDIYLISGGKLTKESCSRSSGLKDF